MSELVLRISLYGVKICPAVIVGTVLMLSCFLSIFFGNLWYFNKHFIYDLTSCGKNGISCPFCVDTKCICNMGWTGDDCTEKIFSEDDYEYIPVSLWDYDSLARETNGNLNTTQCGDACFNTSTCKGYTWNPCDTVIGDLCVQECEFIEAYAYFNQSIYITYYQRINETASQKWLYIKNNFTTEETTCFGLVCYYNSKYGLTNVDDLTYENAKYTTNTLLQSLPTCANCTIWRDQIADKMGDYTKMKTQLGNVLEITELPYLELANLLNQSLEHKKEFVSMTVACTKYAFYKDIHDFDYNLIINNKGLNFLTEDLSKRVIDYTTCTRYDTIVMIMPFYLRKNIPLLLTNAYNMLNDNGYIIIRGDYWTNINYTSLYNSCSAAGMITEELWHDFKVLFKTIHYVEDDPDIEPYEETGSYPDPTPFPYKNTDCWNWNDYYYHPYHEVVWFSFIGKK